MQTVSPMPSQNVVNDMEMCHLMPRFVHFAIIYRWPILAVLSLYLITVLYLACRRKIGWIWFVFPALVTLLFVLALFYSY